MSPIDHIFLYLLLFGTIFFFQNRVFCQKKDFYLQSLIPIIVFTIVEGFRYGRGQDYLHYKEVYEGVDDSNDLQLLFNFIIEIFRNIGLNYVFFFLFASFLFVISVFCFIKKIYDKEGRYMYLLAILAMLLNFECFVRQYLAMPFLFLGLYSVIKGKNIIISLASFVVIALLHTGLLFCVPFLVFSYFFVKKHIPLKFALLTLISAYYLIPPGFFSNTFVESLNFFMSVSGGVTGNPMGDYVESSDRWLGEDSLLEGSAQTPLTEALQLIFECSVLILGNFALKKRPQKQVLFLYNIMFIGFVFCRVFHGYEIFQRLFGELYIFWFVPAGYGLYILNVFKEKKYWYPRFASLTMIIYLLAFWGRFIFLSPEADYVWNH